MVLDHFCFVQNYFNYIHFHIYLQQFCTKHLISAKGIKENFKSVTALTAEGLSMPQSHKNVQFPVFKFWLKVKEPAHTCTEILELLAKLTNYLTEIKRVSLLKTVTITEIHDITEMKILLLE